jgi:Kef-type K+ transport system membrane component KefB
VLFVVAGGVVGALWFAAQAPGGANGLPGAACATGTEKTAPLAALLVSIATITLAARGVGALFERYLRQPAVMGEIAAGIMLGPSVLGAFAPDAQAVLFAPEAVPYLGAVAKLGVVLFMFLVGLEVDPGHLRGQARATLAVSHASIAVPFALGAAMTPWLYGPYAGPRTDFLVFGLFLGISLAVTAFPVLARLLQDRGESRTTLGATALSLAALGDATAWFLLALISGLARAGHVDPWPMLGAIALFGLVVAFGLRPLLRWLAEREARRGAEVSRNVLALVFSLLLLSAVTTELIGIHALFGAFAFGVVIPHASHLAEQLRARMESLVGVLLLPVFFAYTGLRTEIGLVDTVTDILICAAIIGVATLGKLGGTALGARFMGMPGRDALALGVLMNTRGLMELIVLNVGLDMGVLSPTLFAMLVLMALVTTFATAPLYDRVRRSPEP